MTTSPAALHLATIGILWPHLDQALDQHGTAAWPPAGRMRDYLTALDQADAAELRALERDPQQVGETRAPLNIRILDTARIVERLLVDLADEIAPQITEPSSTHAPIDWQARGWTPGDRRRRDTTATLEQADPTRWRYVGLRTVEYAAGWLYARTVGEDGPFRPLTLHHQERITVIAAGCADRIRSALQLLDHQHTLPTPCPRCRGTLVMTTGAADPRAQCSDCGRVWTLYTPAAA
ncbi:hypothetical protein [Streptomyces sp. NPDC093093]|uniref:hypothetical protein n=1 Tax=Streptomyces sp. NPDC093093 TaxID=3366025 RepID=UPI00381CDB3E